MAHPVAAGLHSTPCRLQGQQDPPLNAAGLAQAKALASSLCRSKVWDALYSSDLQRAGQTAQAIAEANRNEPIPVRYSAAFRERCLGVLEVATNSILEHYKARSGLS